MIANLGINTKQHRIKLLNKASNLNLYNLDKYFLYLIRDLYLKFI